MNIFYLDSDPKTCAQYHVDKHVVKMILEYAQLLSTAHRLLDGQEVVSAANNRKKKIWVHPDVDLDATLYKATHINHPSAKWCRHSLSNYQWLFDLWVNLLDEYTHRYGKEHASIRLLSTLSKAPKNIDFFEPFCAPWRAMPDECKLDRSVKDYTIKSYQKYYNVHKSSMFSWKNREIPYFVEKLHD